MSNSLTLVTGAGGFIGSAVVRKLLARGRKVRALLAPGEKRTNLEGLDVEIRQGDITSRATMTEALLGCDRLFHLAAIYQLWLPDPGLMYRVNVEGSKTVLWAAYKAGLERVVFTSSIAAVGARSDGQPSTEADVFGDADWRAGNAYIRSKWLSELDAKRFADEGLPLVIVNPSFPFGARDVGPTPTGGFILEALAGRIPGWVDSGLSLIDVDDCAEGHLLAEDKGVVGERYILATHNVHFRDFYRTISQVAGIEVPDRKLPRAVALSYAAAMEQWGKFRNQRPTATYKGLRYTAYPHYFDGGRAQRELGLPTTPFEVTVEKAVRWWRENGYA